VIVQGKVWGTTSPLFCRNNVELHRITGVRGGYSSRHHHAGKYNQFFVERGAIVVRVWRDERQDETTLRAGMTCTVAPGELHQFEVLDDDTVALEVYWAELNTDDIVRQDAGGKR
jgi:quercetin dioxygenase-like cupin family protein